jgi:hypothetical protein
MAINHKGTSLILAIILCVVGIVGKYWLDHKAEWWNADVDARVARVLEKDGGVQRTLQQVSETVNRTQTSLDDLKPFIHDVVTRQFENASKLPATTLQQRLPAVQHLLTVAKDQGFTADRKVLDVLAHKLSTSNRNAPAFWPTATELISYRSISTAPFLPQNLPDCTDHDPQPPVVTDAKSTLVPPSLTVTFSIMTYKNCRITLDSKKDTDKINWLITHAATSYLLNFSHCLVVYRGGQIDLIMAVFNQPLQIRVGNPNGQPLTMKGKYSGRTVRFEECSYDFSFSSEPPTQGQTLTQSILAQNGPELAFHLK